MKTHTKGPWEWNRWTRAVYDNKDQEIAAVRTHTIEKEHEVTPNGLLIAAAPDLFKICLEIEEHGAENKGTMKRLRAAIEKASNENTE